MPKLDIEHIRKHFHRSIMVLIFDMQLPYLDFSYQMYNCKCYKIGLMLQCAIIQIDIVRYKSMHTSIARLILSHRFHIVHIRHVYRSSMMVLMFS